MIYFSIEKRCKVVERQPGERIWRRRCWLEEEEIDELKGKKRR